MSTFTLFALAFAALAAGGYASLIAWHRRRYDTVHHVAVPKHFELLDCFIPSPEVLEHHQIAVNAPAAVVLDTAQHLRVMDSALVRATIKAREIALGGTPDRRWHPGALIDQMKSIGWVVLAERPAREIVLGAAAIPWQADPEFRAIHPAHFEAFREPGYVKIAWSLRVEPVDAHRCVFHTETRVATTDLQARAQFKRYWSFVAPGVELIRLALLLPLKRASERRADKMAA